MIYLLRKYKTTEEAEVWINHTSGYTPMMISAGADGSIIVLYQRNGA